MVSERKREYIRTMRVLQSWPLWYAVIGAIGLVTLPVVYFLKREWTIYSLALTTPLWILIGIVLSFSLIGLIARGVVWIVGFSATRIKGRR